ncbi:FAD/NAD(P)-binding oxidoreductase [Agaricicola taiwanensis]|uniref:FAD/NAD(P)-binding oxidoreductase n=1 Tax=Agaricicola taiwanensis TaxID=591372 RepID=A0A8J2VMS8_9RHOB|nr:NAD(P)/FAD-dependent oxidoreductase [Agaricicola taiwanensis]GGE32200.1 FAD/NAD(P)-binding oxidoreductase [Agaricicola taiwanensis]
MSTDRVVVIGAGPAGIRAAETLVRNGIRPVLIDEAARGGGQIYRQPPRAFRRSGKDLYGWEAPKADGVHSALARIMPDIDYHPETLVWNAREGKLDLLRAGRVAEISFDRIIVATGARDRVLPFEGWTMPGVFSLGAAQIALKYQGALLGPRIVFAGTGPLLYLVAYQYAAAGAAVAGVIDSAPFGAQVRALPDLLRQPVTLAKGLFYRAFLHARGIPVWNAALPVEALGSGTVEGLTWSRKGQRQDIACDAVATGFGLCSETQIADLLGCKFEYDDSQRCYLPQVDGAGRSSRAEVYLAGDGSGIGGADLAERAGERAALALLEDIGHSHDNARAVVLDGEIGKLRHFRRGLETAFPAPGFGDFQLNDDLIICRCEEITFGEARRAIAANEISELNRLKALTRIGMGRCQGRSCAPAAAELLAQCSGGGLASAGRLRAQAPIKPVPLAAIGVPPP